MLCLWRNFVLVLALASVGGQLSCSFSDAPPPLAAGQNTLAQSVVDPAVRTERALAIREEALAAGILSGELFAGIGEAETILSHCAFEVNFGCPGPPSDDCSGAAILAGGGDGPCALQEGGLGMFQFDAGTYEDTLALYGERVLSFDGNVALAIEFMIERIIRSVYVDNVQTREEAIAWINEAGVGGPNYDAWIDSVTHYYNGCVPGSCSVYTERRARYSDATFRLFDEFGGDFWREGDTSPRSCTVPPGGVIVEEDNPCVARFGDPIFFREVNEGSAGKATWTFAINNDVDVNFMRWRFVFESRGQYELSAFLDGGVFGRSQQSRYNINLQGNATTVIIDQSISRGFTALSFLDVEAGDVLEVSLGDNTGEALDTQTEILFDALKLVATSENPGEENPGEENPREENPREEDLIEQEPLLHCVCVCADLSASAPWFSLVALLFLLLAIAPQRISFR